MNWLTRAARVWHAEHGKSRVFGVILYTDAHANVKKVLRDEDYWKALNEESGPSWAVFAVTALPGHWGYPSFPPGTVGMMIPVWKEPAANRDLLADFGIESTKELPILLVFFEATDGTLRTTCLDLDDSSPDTAYNSLKNAVRLVRETLERVYPENLATPGAYFAVQSAVSNHREWRVIKQVVAGLERIKSLLL